MTPLRLDGHRPMCNDYCAVRHCPCGADAAHGVGWCHDCGRKAAGRLVPNLGDEPGVRLAIRAARQAHTISRRRKSSTRQPSNGSDL